MIIFTTNLWMHQSNLKISSKTADFAFAETPGLSEPVARVEAGIEGKM